MSNSSNVWRCSFCARSCDKQQNVCKFCNASTFRFRRLYEEFDEGPGTTYMVKDFTRDKQLHAGLDRLRKSQEFTDITLVCADGKLLPCHKVVLATNPYFHAMFTTDMRENKENKVIFEHVEVDVMGELLSFLYTGEMTVTLGNASQLLEAACMLQFDRVQEICCEYLSHHICVTNCVEMWVLADMLGCCELARKVKDVAVHSFDKLAAGSALLSLNDMYMCQYMSCRPLCATPFDAVKMVVRWYTYDRETRRNVLPSILSQLDLNSLMPEEPKKVVLSGEPQQNWADNNGEQLKHLASLYALSEQEMTVIKESLSSISTKPIVFTEGETVLQYVTQCAVLVAGEKHHNRAPEYDYNRRIFVDQIALYCPEFGADFLGGTPIFPGLTGCSIAIWEDKLFITGGEGDMGVGASLWCFSLTSQTWEFKVSMSLKRSYHGSAVISNVLYIFGGRIPSSGMSTDHVEAWDLVTMEPVRKQMPAAPQKFSLAASCVCSGKIYVFGGEGYWNEEPLPWIQSYDPKGNTWVGTESLMVANRGSAAAAMGEKIYVVGGELWSGVLEYVPSTGQISTLPGLHYPRAFHCVAVLSGKVYVFGGKDVANNEGTKLYELPSEVYDANSATWKWLDSSRDECLKCYWERVFGFGCAVFPAIQYSFD